MIFDLAIIGGGPAGYTAAERAKEAGRSVILFEKNGYGGVCLNEGCIPTKTILYSAKLYDSVRDGVKYGITTDNRQFDYGKIIARKTKIVKKLTAGIRTRLSDLGVTMVNHSAVIRSYTDDKFYITADGTTYESTKLLIATGSESIIPPIKGIEQTDYWTSREALMQKTVPESIVIIGGGVIGVEFASIYCSFGAKVTVVEMLDEILTGMDGELSALLCEELTKRGVTFMLSTKVTAVANGAVTVEKDGETTVLECENILLSVGRRPVTKGFGLESLNPTMERSGIRVNDRMQTDIPNLYACGDVTGYSLLAHTASREAEVAVDNMLGGYDVMSYRAIPGVVYTHPELSGVGETEESLQRKGIAYHAHKLPMTFAGRYVAENEGGTGVCKLLSSPDGAILGVHVLGSPSSEFITAATTAIELNLTMSQWKRIVFPHPTVSEIFKECIHS